MSIASELTNLQQDITNARAKIVEKGGSVTSGGGSSQLATDIATIPTSSISINGQSEGFPARPFDAPNLDLIDLTNFYGVYTTIEVKRIKNQGYTFTNVITGYNIPQTHSIYRGHLNNDGQFVNDETLFTNVTGFNAIQVQDNWSDYTIIKHDVGQGFGLNGFGGDANKFNVDLEIVAKSTKAIGRVSNASIKTSASRLKMIGFNNSYVWENVVGRQIKYCELEDFDWSAQTGQKQLNMFFSGENTLTKLVFKNQTLDTLTNNALSFNSMQCLEVVDFTGSHFPSLTSLAYVFRGCTCLTDVKNMDCIFDNAQNITSISNLFSSCQAIKKIELHNKNFSSCTNADDFIYRSAGLRIIDFSGCKFPSIANWGNLTTYNDGWENVQYFRIGEIYGSIQFDKMTSLTHDNLVEILDDLGTVTSSKTITIGATNLAKLSSAEIQVAIDKGWSVA